MQALQLTYQGGIRARLTAELLRLESPAANARQSLKARRPDLEIVDVQPVGSYAVQLSFSDGHTHGIYSWAALHQLAEHKFARMRYHVQAVQAARADVQAFRARHRQSGSSAPGEDPAG